MIEKYHKKLRFTSSLSPDKSMNFYCGSLRKRTVSPRQKSKVYSGSKISKLIKALEHKASEALDKGDNLEGPNLSINEKDKRESMKTFVDQAAEVDFIFKA